METCIAILAILFRMKSSAKANEDLKTVAEALLPLSNTVHRSRFLERQLISISTALNLPLPDAATRRIINNSGVRPTFTIAQERPGDLSEDGARHDNDSADINDIEILPTMEEIQCSRLEYLPRDDPSEWHVSGVPGLIDRHFRLVREDTVGQLRDAAKFELERLHDPNNSTSNTKERQGARTNVYRNVRFEDVIHDDQQGMIFVLSLEQPQQAQKMKAKERKLWWEDSKRLGSDSLICLMSSNGEATFLVVSSPPSTTYTSEKKKANKQKALRDWHDRYPLAGDGYRGCVIAQLTTLEADSVTGFLERCIAMMADQHQHSLIEFPGVVLPAFKPTLQALKDMAESLDIPFASSLLPDAETETKPPAYSSTPNFRWNLQSLVKDTDRGVLADEKMEATLQRSSLDEAQQRAVHHALTNQVSLIQGPPGNGKSYTGIKLIQTLLDNKKAGNLGPIVCVCFTKHALDQLLEHLVDAGVELIIRIGSRSKSERLADINLREAANKIELHKEEKRERWEAKKKMEEASKKIGGEIKRLSSINGQNEEAVESHLKEKHPSLYDKIFQETDEDGFQTVRHSGSASPLHDWLQGGGPPRPPGERKTLTELKS